MIDLYGLGPGFPGHPLPDHLSNIEKVRHIERGSKGRCLRGIAQDFQISGGPNWLSSARYDINAKAEDSFADGVHDQSEHGRFGEHGPNFMLRSLLAERFKLALRQELRRHPVYLMVIGKTGQKLHLAQAADSEEDPGPLHIDVGEISGERESLSSLADLLSIKLGRTVVDKTGLQGLYDFTLKWTPDENEAQLLGRDSSDAPPSIDRSAPSIFIAIQQQLGLRLESAKGPVKVFVIDSVEPPSEN